MTDKEKIRAEVMRLRTIIQKEVFNSDCPEDADLGEIEAYTEILSFIDSLQEESTTSVWHDANTLPSDPKAVIVEHNEYSTSICRAEQMSRVKGAKWAYIDDLLKL